MDVQTQHSVQHSLDRYALALDIIPCAMHLILTEGAASTLSPPYPSGLLIHALS